MKIKDLRKKDKKSLENLIEEEREKLRKLRFDLSHGKLKDVKQLQRVKKDIARILTILNQNLKS